MVPNADAPFLQRLLLTVLVVGLALAITLILWFHVHVLLLGFAGLILAVFLYRTSQLLSRHLHLPYWLGLLITCTLLLALFAGVFVFSESRLSEQADQFRQRLPELWDKVHAYLQQRPWGQRLLQQAHIEFGDASQRGLIASGVNYLAALGNIIIEILVVAFIGLFGAINPEVYTRGLIRLAPPPQRQRARQVLLALGDLLWWWLLGQFAAMAFIGLITALTLWALGVPLALLLGLIAALLNFVPNFGPIVATIPAVMLALLQGPWTALYVLLAYLAIQILQDYLVTPLVQQEAVSLPPAILVLAQILMYYYAGLLGMLLAPPLAAIVIKLVKMLYVQDTLQDPTQDRKGFWPDYSEPPSP